MGKIAGELTAGAITAVLVGLVLNRYFAVKQLVGAGSSAAGNLLNAYGKNFLAPYPTQPKG